MANLTILLREQLFSDQAQTKPVGQKDRFCPKVSLDNDDDAMTILPVSSDVPGLEAVVGPESCSTDSYESDGCSSGSLSSASEELYPGWGREDDAGKSPSHARSLRAAILGGSCATQRGLERFGSRLRKERLVDKPRDSTLEHGLDEALATEAAEAWRSDAEVNVALEAATDVGIRQQCVQVCVPFYDSQGHLHV
eukprot:CAMPEP_0170619880 /NCGR_PEP_ID=MMETSP0224-20130122/27752_1 /TAXON_ID=285029 /ORGANISM="Togula jolla, Strain CCCM 725" /LENGTH=194 /DNA_ID=CAMNT_0010945999 /DNA_START=37 /DNA_END=621 /DNA_ORIENTATION=+